MNVALRVRHALAHAGRVDERRLRNAFEEPSHGRALLVATKALLLGLLSARPLPLQCALFAASAENFAAADDERAVSDVIYLDGIRTLLLLRRLRTLTPKPRIIVDLDDLMSRRFAHLRHTGMSLSLGYLEKSVPKWLRNLLMVNVLGRLLVSYELMALRYAEREMAESADSVVLLNAKEADMLRERVITRDHAASAHVVAIPPPAEASLCETVTGISACAPDFRIVFVGSDTLVQNKATIAYLLRLWETRKIDTKLFIYGRQKGDWGGVPNVTFMGYVPDIRAAYKAGSVLLYPCFVPGGIKTKVLEAFAYGAPVIGNTLTFEGILPADYPLVINKEEDLVALLNSLPAHRQTLREATLRASSYLRREHATQLFQKRWQSVVSGRWPSE